ncbi:hypothetical protein F5B18DRAFT_192456 [Nemania serpens]|nr:hypothetical protein F5B18DRAFT_192456 [Nemania serpens]
MALIMAPASGNVSGSRSTMRPSSVEPRRKSCLSRPSPSLGHQAHYRQQSLPSLKQAMRASLSPLPLAVIPSSPSEWKNTIHEVKQKYLARKYRSCSMQCSDILDNLGDTSAIEPLHLIYLHFYAASSFEWCARPLSSSSAYRTKLLCSAQTHYAEAEALIAAAEWNMTERTRTPSAASTVRPNSPGLSAGSRTSDESSTASSPRTSTFFSDDDSPPKLARPVCVKPKKKVSFSGLPEFFEFRPEPYIRPDSPTLGWDSDVFMSPLETYSPFPVPPKRASPTSIMKTSLEEKTCQDLITTTIDFRLKPSLKSSVRSNMGAIPEPADSDIARTDQEYHHDQERSSTPSNHVFDLESFLQTRTLNRFRGQLSALRDQVARHRAAVDGLLFATSDESTVPTPITPSYEPEIAPSAQFQPLHPSYTTSPPAAHRRNESASVNLAPAPAPRPNPTDRTNTSARPVLRLQTDIRNEIPRQYHHQQHLRSYSSASTSLRQACGSSSSSPVYEPTPTTPTLTSARLLSPTPSVRDDETSLQDRIARLRAGGWRRKRFDGRRYEALREQVLGELAAC